MKKNFIWWGLTILWCGVIFYMSAKTGDESSVDSGWAAQILNSVAEFLTGREDAEIPVLLIRKAAHYTEYFILGILLYMSFYNYKKPEAKILEPAAAGIFYAITDEVHQYFVPGRAMQAFDVAIDALGVLSSISLLFCISRIRAAAQKSD